jgi:hypothetical protein
MDFVRFFPNMLALPVSIVELKCGGRMTFAPADYKVNPGEPGQDGQELMAVQ